MRRCLRKNQRIGEGAEGSRPLPPFIRLSDTTLEAEVVQAILNNP